MQEEFLDPFLLDVVSYCMEPDATVTGFLQLPSVTDHGRCQLVVVAYASLCKLLFT